jgi:hypothetical protein
MANFFVSTAGRILNVESSCIDILGYRPIDLHGQPFAVFAGPRTDLSNLTYALGGGSIGDTDLHLILYSAESKPYWIRVAFTACTSREGQHCSLLRLESSPMMLLEQVFEETSEAWALISSEWPFPVSTGNRQFVSDFGLPGTEHLGQTLECLQPYQDTESSTMMQLFESASMGTISQVNARVRFASGMEGCTTITCLPVASGARNADIDYIMVRFKYEQLQRPAGNEVLDLPSSEPDFRCTNGAPVLESISGRALSGKATPAHGLAHHDNAEALALAPGPPSPRSIHDNLRYAAQPAASAFPVLMSASHNITYIQESLYQHGPPPIVRLGRPIAPPPRLIDEAYIKRLQRRLRLAARRAAATDGRATARVAGEAGLHQYAGTGPGV